MRRPNPLFLPTDELSGVHIIRFLKAATALAYVDQRERETK